jgi:hypothetical protein
MDSHFTGQGLSISGTRLGFMLAVYEIGAEEAISAFHHASIVVQQGLG